MCKYYIAFSHDKGFGSVEISTDKEINSIDDVIDVRRKVEKVTEAKGVVIINWKKFK